MEGSVEGTLIIALLNPQNREMDKVFPPSEKDKAGKGRGRQKLSAKPYAEQ